MVKLGKKNASAVTSLWIDGYLNLAQLLTLMIRGVTWKKHILQT